MIFRRSVWAVPLALGIFVTPAFAAKKTVGRAFAPVFDLASLNGENGFRIVGAKQGHQFGFSVNSAGDFDGDGFDDMIVGAPRASTKRGKTGAAYVIYGKSDGFGAKVDAAELDGESGFKVLGGNPDDFFGISVSSAGHVDGTKREGIFIGATTGPEHAGGYYVIFGSKKNFGEGFDVRDITKLTGFKYFNTSYAPWVEIGIPVCAVGDVDGDGFDDLLAEHADTRYYAGGAELIFGFDPKTSSPESHLIEAGPDTRFAQGTLSSAGDVNGDGFADFIGGAPYDHFGASHVFFGRANRSKLPDDIEDLNGKNGFNIVGELDDNRVGESVAGADVNGDGFTDLITLAAGEDYKNPASRGIGYVVFGHAGPFDKDFDASELDGENGFKLTSKRSFADAKAASAGDVNDDGFDDLIVGISAANGFRGEALVLFGKAEGFTPVVDLDELDGENGFRIPGLKKADRLGNSVASAGDVNGDGVSDLILGAPGKPQGENGPDVAGSAYVIFGQGAVP